MCIAYGVKSTLHAFGRARILEYDHLYLCTLITIMSKSKKVLVGHSSSSLWLAGTQKAGNTCKSHPCFVIIFIIFFILKVNIEAMTSSLEF